MGIREEIAKKRLELAIMEADVRIEDLTAEIQKANTRKEEMIKSLRELDS
jgi:predicted  nucleic acid-binding Zn-ribbon protein